MKIIVFLVDLLNEKAKKKMLFGNKIFRSIMGIYYSYTEGGEFYSKSMRRYFVEQFGAEIGIGSYGCFSNDFVYCSPIIVGNYCSIASGVSWVPGNHPPQDISTHPFFHRPEFGFIEKYDGEKEKPKIRSVGNDVWIGKNALIMPGCRRIGDGAIVGGGAVVTHDVEPYAIVAGNPARTIKYRFDENRIKELLELKWWDLDPTELKKAIPYADDFAVFCQKVKEVKEERNSYQNK